MTSYARSAFDPATQIESPALIESPAHHAEFDRGKSITTSE